MAAVVSCKHKDKDLPKDFPKFPAVNVKVPIVEQEFCEPKGSDNCEVKSFCHEMTLNEESNKWESVAKHPLKFCHGIIGVNHDEYNLLWKWYREAKLWVRKKLSFVEVPGEAI